MGLHGTPWDRKRCTCKSIGVSGCNEGFKTRHPLDPGGLYAGHATVCFWQEKVYTVVVLLQHPFNLTPTDTLRHFKATNNDPELLQKHP